MNVANGPHGYAHSLRNIHSLVALLPIGAARRHICFDLAAMTRRGFSVPTSMILLAHGGFLEKLKCERNLMPLLP
jgi:hypothetical protein